MLLYLATVLCVFWGSELGSLGLPDKHCTDLAMITASLKSFELSQIPL